MDVDARLEALAAENQRLRDELAQLREAMGSGPTVYPAEWGLTGKETRLLGALLSREGCTKEQLMTCLYDARADDLPDIKIIDVFVCKLRRKLKPFGIEIGTIWGQGYSMSPENKAAAKAWLKEAA